MRKRQFAVRNILVNLDDADVDGVSDVILYANLPINDDNTDSVGNDNLNIDGIIGANLHPPHVPDRQVDVAVGVALHPPVVVDQLPDVGNRPPPFDLYAFGVQGSYSDTTVPLPDRFMARMWAQNNTDEHGYYSVDTNYDHNGY